MVIVIIDHQIGVFFLNFYKILPTPPCPMSILKHSFFVVVVVVVVSSLIVVAPIKCGGLMFGPGVAKWLFLYTF